MAADVYRYLTFEDWYREKRIGVLEKWFRKKMQDGYTGARLTTVSWDQPIPGYPDGVYLELWLVKPAEMPAFEFPHSAIC